MCICARFPLRYDVPEQPNYVDHSEVNDSPRPSVKILPSLDSRLLSVGGTVVFRTVRPIQGRRSQAIVLQGVPRLSPARVD